MWCAQWWRCREAQGSALVAYLVASVFEDSTILCIGKSAALQPEKLQRARFVADLLGIAQCPGNLACRLLLMV